MALTRRFSNQRLNAETRNKMSAKQVIETTFWRRLDNVEGKQLPLKTILLTWNVDGAKGKGWLSSPVAFEHRELADDYASSNKTVSFLVIPDARMA